MKLTLMVENTRIPDGEDSEIIITKNDLETVEDFLYAYAQFMRAVGFTYVESVGAVSTGKDPKEYWSMF